MTSDTTTRMQTLKRRRSESTQQLITWSIVIGIPLVIAFVVGSYFENHLTFEESYLNQTSKRSDISYGIGLFLMALGFVVLIVLILKRNVIDKEIAEVDRIKSAAQQADLIGAAVKSYEKLNPVAEPDVNTRLAQLERIGKLLADGTISQVEFDLLKVELMK